jgi:sugar/nucleoside kinase (ribokinase family)
VVASAKVTYLEGYLFDRPEPKEAYWQATEIASGAGRLVALTLSDTFCVERHRDDWLPLIHDRVDILFANEAEACSLWGCDEAGAAVERARAEVGIACITLGDKGSVVVAGTETHEIPCYPTEVVDTTGAGDLYAAGFLYGYTSGRSLPEAGRLGGLAASEVIGHTGARPEIALSTLVEQLG